MTNFEKYKENLTAEKFADSMIFNCVGCPAYPCNAEPMDGDECYYNLLDWCAEEVRNERGK